MRIFKKISIVILCLCPSQALLAVGAGLYCINQMLNVIKYILCLSYCVFTLSSARSLQLVILARVPVFANDHRLCELIITGFISMFFIVSFIYTT